MEDFGSNPDLNTTHFADPLDSLPPDPWFGFNEAHFSDPLLYSSLQSFDRTLLNHEAAVDLSGCTSFDAGRTWDGVGPLQWDTFPGGPMTSGINDEQFLPTIQNPPRAPARQHIEAVSALTCSICRTTFPTYADLTIHAYGKNHATLKCPVDSCNIGLTTAGKEKRRHMRSVHPDVFQCDECDYVGRSQNDVAFHASDSGHAAFACKHDECEKKFSRLDTYRRHVRVHRDDAQRYPCKYCKQYRGPNGFKRKDHLTQHIRNYHHIGEDNVRGSLYSRKSCPKEDCPMFRPVFGDRSFKNSAEWVKHMRSVHDESDFPCSQPGCDRVNGKGYFRKADLRAHLRKVHCTDGHIEDNGD